MKRKEFLEQKERKKSRYISKQLTAEMVATALKATNGIKYKAAAALGTSPQNLSYWCRQCPELEILSNQLREGVDDRAQDNLSAVVLADPDSIDPFRQDNVSMWWLSNSPKSGFRKSSPETSVTINNNIISVTLDPRLKEVKEERERMEYKRLLVEEQDSGEPE